MASVPYRALLLLILLLRPDAAARAEEAINLSTRPGVTQPVLFTSVPNPAASVLLFPGAAGQVSRLRNNFLLRVVPNFAASGLNVAVVDTPSDHPSGMDDAFRMSADHATDVAAVVALARQRAAVPVWLVGTSRGTISAASVAVLIGPPRIAGLVLTSTVWVAGIPQIKLEDIKVPTLVVHNRDDACVESPFAQAAPGYARLTAAPAKQLIAVSGGANRSKPCDALSTHGYYQIEDQVVPLIVTWIKAH